MSRQFVVDDKHKRQGRVQYGFQYVINALDLINTPTQHPALKIPTTNNITILCQNYSMNYKCKSFAQGLFRWSTG